MRYDRRTRQLEAQLERLSSVYDSLTRPQWRAMIDTWLENLIRLGLVSAPDLEHPHASLESIRRAGTHRTQLEALRQTVCSEPWQRAHRPAAMAVFLRVLQQHR